MSTFFVLAVAGPAACAMLSMMGMPRALRVVAYLAGLAGSASLLGHAIRDGGVAGAGFEADPVRAGIAVALSGIGIAALLRSTEGEAAWSASVAAGVGSVLAVHVVSAAALIVATTAGIGVSAAAPRTRDSVRVFFLLAATDVAVITGLALAAGDSARVPAEITGLAAWPVALGAVVRATVLGSPRWVDAWLEDPGSPRAAVLGGARAQGILLAIWVARSGPTGAAIVAVAAGVVAAAAAARAVRERSWGSGLAAQAALVLTALGIGTEAAALGALLVGAGLAAATTVVLAGERTAIGPSLGAAALGASFAGVALVAGEALARAAIDRPFLLVALTVIAAALWLAVAGGAGFGTGHPAGAAAVPAGLGLGLVALLAILPGTVAERVGDAAARSITGTVPLAPVASAVGDRVGLAFAVAALGATLAVGRGAIQTPTPEPRASGPVAGVRQVLAAWALEGVALVGLVALFASGLARGWL